jgi:hypothetical protein
MMPVGYFGRKSLIDALVVEKRAGLISLRFPAIVHLLNVGPLAGKTTSPAELFYKRSFRTKLPTLSDFYNPLEAAMSENKFRVGEKVRLQNDKSKRWDDTGTIYISVMNQSLETIYLKRLAPPPPPPPVNVLRKGSQISPSSLLLPLPLGVSEAVSAEPAAIPHIRTSSRRKQPPVRFEP